PPVAEMLHADVAALRTRADRLAADLAGAGVDARAVDCAATVGGGGAPGVELPSAAVSLPEAYAAPLRSGRPPVVGRVEHGRCLLDLRTVPNESDAAVRDAVLGARPVAGEGR
ncbi:MAG: L-seryl-tRNA(Sec) selenium transferase, partial [Actinomycetes bacterium]